jgi:hypothetical protein
MEIHPSQGPIHSFKDFLFHLLTVVIGILIALSLEGLLSLWASLARRPGKDRAQQSLNRMLNFSMS